MNNLLNIIVNPGREARKKRDPEDLEGITEASDMVYCLKRALEMRKDEFIDRAVETLIKFIVGDNSKATANLKDLDNASVHMKKQDAILLGLGACGVCSTVNALLLTGINSPKTSTLSLRAIVLLLRDSKFQNMNKFISMDTLAIIVKTAHCHMNNPSVIETVLICLRDFSSASIWPSLSAQVYSAALVELSHPFTGYGGIGNGSAVLTYSHAESVLLKLVTSNCCSMIIQALRTHVGYDPIVELACRFIYNVTMGDSEGAALARADCAREGACPLLTVSILSDRLTTLSKCSDEKDSHQDSSSASLASSLTCVEWAIRAVGGLARRNETVKRQLGELGTCGAVVSAAGLLDPDANNRSLCESICWAAGNLSYPDELNQSRLQEAGAAEFVLLALRKHGGSGDHEAAATQGKSKDTAASAFAQEAFRAIRNISCDNDSITAALVANGVCRELLNVIHRFTSISSADRSSSSVSFASGANYVMGMLTTKLHAPVGGAHVLGAVQWGWYAVASLAEHPLALAEFRSLQVSELLYSTLDKFCSSSDVCQWACIAAATVAVDEQICLAIGLKMSDVLVKVLSAHAETLDILTDVIRLLAILSEKEANRVLLADAGSAAAVVNALKKHVRSNPRRSSGTGHTAMGGTASLPLGVLSVIGGAENATGAAGDGEKAADDSNDEDDALEELVQHGSLLLKRLCDKKGELPMNQIVQAGGCKLLTLMITAFPGNVEVAEHCCTAVASLASVDIFNYKLEGAGIGAAIVQAVLRHRNELNFLFVAIRTFAGLFDLPQNIARLKSDGICGAVIQALAANRDSSLDFSRLCFSLIIQLAEDEGCRALLAERSLKSAEIIVESLLVHADEREIALIGLTCITSLCGMISSGQSGGSGARSSSSISSSSKRSGSTGGYFASSVMGSLAPFFQVQELGDLLGSLPVPSIGTSLSSDVGAATGTPTGLVVSLGEVGAGALVEVIMRKHAFSRGSASPATEDDDEENRGKEEVGGQCEKDGDIVTLDVGVVVACCLALNALAAYPENRLKLHQAGCCDVIVDSLFLYMREYGAKSFTNQRNNSLMTAACMAIGSIAKDGGESSVIRDLFGSRGACQLLSDILAGCTKDAPATLTGHDEPSVAVKNKVEQIENATISACVCRAIAFLAQKHLANKERFLVGGACKAVVQSLKKYLESEKTTKFAIQAIAELAEDFPPSAAAFSAIDGSPQDKARLSDSGIDICRYLVISLKSYLRSEEHTKACCQAVVALKDLNVALGKEGMCEALVLALCEHTDSEIAHWGTRAVASLAWCAASPSDKSDEGAAEVAGSHQNRRLLIDAFACQAVIGAVNHHVGNESILSVMMQRSSSSEQVAQWGCEAIFSLAGTYSKFTGSVFSDAKLDRNSTLAAYQNHLNESSACEAVAKAYLRYWDVETVATAACRAISVIAGFGEPFRLKLGSLGVCPCIVDGLHAYSFSSELSMWGCRAVAVLSSSAEISNTQKFVSAGVCESLSVAMLAHQMNPGVAAAGADAIASVASSDYDGSGGAADKVGSGKTASGISGGGHTNSFANLLGRSGACEALVSVLRSHLYEAWVLEKACHAITTLCRMHQRGNTGWFGATGCCEALLRVEGEHRRHAKVSSALWLAIASLCSDENNRCRLGDGGACEAAVEAMCLHLDSKEVVWATAMAIERLCDRRVGSLVVNTPSAAKQLAANGTSSSSLSSECNTEGESKEENHPAIRCSNLLLQFKYRFTNSTTTIALPEENERAFLEDAIDYAAQTILRYCSPKESLNEFANIDIPSAASNISRTIPLSNERQKLYHNGCCEILGLALKFHIASEGTACNLLRSVAVMAKERDVLVSTGDGFRSNDFETAERFCLGAAGACAAAVKAISLHPKSESIARWASVALCALAASSQRNQVLIIEARGCEAIVQTLRGHKNSRRGAYTVAACARTIFYLTRGSSQSKEMLGAAGACAGLIDAIDTHGKDADVTYSVCLAMAELSCGSGPASSFNRSTFYFSGATDILVASASRHIDSGVVVEAVLLAMVALCVDKVGRHKLALAGACKTAVQLVHKYEYKPGAVGISSGPVSPSIGSAACLTLVDEACAVSSAACAAIAALSCKVPDNQLKLAQGGACKIVATFIERTLSDASQIEVFASVLKVIRTVPDSTSAMESGSATDGKGGDNALPVSSGSRNFSSRDGATDTLLQPDFRPSQPRSLLLEAMRACRCLVEGSDANRLKMSSLGVSESLIAIIAGNGRGSCDSATIEDDVATVARAVLKSLSA